MTVLPLFTAIIIYRLAQKYLKWLSRERAFSHLAREITCIRVCGAVLYRYNVTMLLRQSMNWRIRTVQKSKCKAPRVGHVYQKSNRKDKKDKRQKTD